MNATPVNEKGLGTFAGVFTPSILTILGLVLFLRLGYVLGNMGLVRSLAILAIATSVSVLTSLSLATATSNLRIRGGGVYFLISRTLGIEFGGAVGLVLFVAMSVSVGFYSIGFAEAVEAIAGGGTTGTRLIAASCVVVLFYLAWLGADWATRLQYLVMGLLVLALLSFFAGAIGDVSGATLEDGIASPDTDVDFWEAFAVFFPAITGFTQGVAMSGDLRTPSRSVVTGTFLAVGISTVIYVGVLVLLTAALPLLVLREDTTTVMGDLSVVEWTASAGVIAATLSSAMASLLGAPRVLQRIGEDRIVPSLRTFASGVGPMNNPRRATVLAAAIALGTVAVGDINTISPLITMFFLASYGMINYATYYEARAASTSFRPRFRWYHRRVSLAGAVACAAVVVAINPIAGAIAAIVLWGIYTYLSRQDVPARWTDSVHAHHYAEARRNLRALDRETGSQRDWRPAILLFVPHDSEQRRRLLHIATWLEGDAGFTTAVRLIEGSGPQLRRQSLEVGLSLETEIAEEGLQVFARAILAADLRTGIQAVVQAHGLGPVKPNVAVFGWADLDESEAGQRQRYGDLLQECARFSTHVVVVNCNDPSWSRLEATPAAERTISVWWSQDSGGSLMTMLAWLCTRDPAFASASLEVYVPHTDDDPDAVATVEALLYEARIDARVLGVPAASPIKPTVNSSTLAFVPLRVRRGEPLGPNETPLEELGDASPVTVMVLATDDFTLDVEPDESTLAKHAEAVDSAVEATQRAEELDADASRLLVEAEILRLEFDESSEATDVERQAQLESAVQRAEIEAATAYRRYVEARARADDRWRLADELDPERDRQLIDPGAWDAGRSAVSGSDTEPDPASSARTDER